MQYFPIFLNLANQPVLVVGGGAVGARKIELLLKSGAQVTVVAPTLNANVAALVSRGAVKHLAEEFRPGHLDGMRLAIAATSRQAVNAWVAHQADVRSIPVNVVDDRELSRFIMPAIVDRSPVIVAVSSGGDAPVLTRRLREKLEAFLPTRIGALAQFAGGLRSKVKNRIGDPRSRRKFWERFFDGPAAADVLAGREDQAMNSAEQSLRAASEQQDSIEWRGEVALVGAGPGDPGLLTLRALRVLQNADVIFYDRLVSGEVLALARRDAEMISVGKAAGCAPIPQTQINKLLVEHALAGKRVVRLKGGDPFIFGRGGEELEELARNGIRFEVVPGITAAAGCAAYAGIPLTHREHAQTLTFVTGHNKDAAIADNLDWVALARPSQTVVFYMGLHALPKILARLREHGAPESRAAAVIEHGTQSTQRVILGTLADLESRVGEAGVSSPALLIVGEVTRLHETLHWFNSTAAREHLDQQVGRLVGQRVDLAG
ncbi:MAG: uroporphyrinogen-III C-methyltransferase [Candidatus Obscuribacterales bacterium]|nr:uroporphyrinogen-III C-methyltransferase [Steroidobacteraceae bacterium]